jgi:hypothetical protein
MCAAPYVSTVLPKRKPLLAALLFQTALHCTALLIHYAKSKGTSEGMVKRFN